MILRRRFLSGFNHKGIDHHVKINLGRSLYHELRIGCLVDDIGAVGSDHLNPRMSGRHNIPAASSELTLKILH
jgi:hypothetical protein